MDKINYLCSIVFGLKRIIDLSNRDIVGKKQTTFYYDSIDTQKMLADDTYLNSLANSSEEAVKVKKEVISGMINNLSDDSAIINKIDTNRHCFHVEQQQTFFKVSSPLMFVKSGITISFYFKIDSQDCLEEFLADNNHYIPFLQFGNGKINSINGKTNFTNESFVTEAITASSVTTSNTIEVSLAHSPETNNPCIIVYSNRLEKNVKYIEATMDNLQVNKWYHVVIECDAKNDRIYIDGRRRYELDSNAILFHDITNELLIGCYLQSAETGIMDYSLDDISICDHVLYTEDFDIDNKRYMIELFPEEEIITNEKISYDTKDHVYGAPGFYGGDKTRWDQVLDPLEITRPVYWKKEKTADIKNKEKHEFYINNKTAASNFGFIDRMKEKEIEDD